MVEIAREGFDPEKFLAGLLEPLPGHRNRDGTSELSLETQAAEVRNRMAVVFSGENARLLTPAQSEEAITVLAKHYPEQKELIGRLVQRNREIQEEKVTLKP